MKRYSVCQYANEKNITLNQARYQLEKLVKAKKATKCVDEPIWNTGCNLPVKVATYIVEGD